MGEIVRLRRPSTFEDESDSEWIKHLTVNRYSPIFV
jgi:hypothetical protein